MNEIALVALTALFCTICYGAWRSREALANLEAAWPYRRDLARLAYAVEQNCDFPEDARRIVGFLADRAFDKAFAKELTAEVRRSRNTDKDRPQSLLRKLQHDYGEQAGILVHKAILAYVAIVFHMESRAHWRSLPPSNARDVRRRQMWSVWAVAQRLWRDEEGCGAFVR